LRAAGIDPVAEAFFRDHHAYTEKDLRDLLQLRERSEASGFVTTEKDAVNLGGYLDALAPLAVVPVKMELADPANAVDTILRAIEEGHPRSWENARDGSGLRKRAGRAARPDPSRRKERLFRMTALYI